MDERQLITELKTLRVAQVGGQRAPHKPLLLLWLLHIFVKRRRWDTTYDEAEAPVGSLISKYTPGAAEATDLAANPFIRLERSIWELRDSTGTAIASSPSRSGSWLKTRGAHGHLRTEVAQLLNDPRTLVAAIEALLQEYFTPDVAAGVRTELGLDLVFSAPASSLRRLSLSVSKRVDLPEESTTFRRQFHLPENYENLNYDTRLRWQALMWLVQVRATNDNRIPSSQLSLFEFEGKRIALADRQRGIRKPKELEAALSIKTTYTRKHRSRPYEDGMIRDRLHRYKYAGDDHELLHERRPAPRLRTETTFDLLRRHRQRHLRGPVSLVDRRRPAGGAPSGRQP
ncbi:hypothetical protein [Amycolatopsis sp. DG1A-15b]|uniref:hypothetical protein n=1 Tax=Amycolatopsis sp. DG1A-15b TaxID=3052846 RepID=UPI00255B7B46|nr:hypothetical protein [Amycolatopsis sp. DG1A-15b]WIX87090.1 hypothetical protein QRY02_38975 [Amycolatopsis sp. DG1A-15b]